MTRAKKRPAKKDKPKIKTSAKPSQGEELTEKQLADVVGGSTSGALLTSPAATSAVQLPATQGEVIVAFEAGNPDRPIVIGRVNNKSSS